MALGERTKPGRVAGAGVTLCVWEGVMLCTQALLPKSTTMLPHCESEYPCDQPTAQPPPTQLGTGTHGNAT